MELRIKTLTPLWTGGVETGKVDRIHETGILGSLRWWYEIIVRGLGGEVCDPTSENADHRCHFDTEAYNQALQDGLDRDHALQIGLQSVCTVCRLFGCTGWKRRFELSLEVTPDQLTPFWLATLDRAGKFNHWWLSQVFQVEKSRVCFCDMTIHARFRHGYESHGETLKSILSLIANYGAIGAKTQYGFGQFAYPDAYPNEQSVRILRDQINHLAVPKNLKGSFYSLDDFWHMQCHIPDNDRQIKKFQAATVIGNEQNFKKHKNQCLPVSFDIRYKLPGSHAEGLRQTFRLAHGKQAARQVFGTVQSEDQKWGSRVFVSHLFKDEREQDYQLRVWGFTDPSSRAEIESALQTVFSTIRITTTTGQNILGLGKEVS